MGHGAQVFKGVALLRHGVGGRVVDLAEDRDGAGHHLYALPLALGGHERAVYFHRAARAEGRDGLVVGKGLIRHHLNRVEGRAIVQGQEREAAF